MSQSEQCQLAKQPLERAVIAIPGACVAQRPRVGDQPRGRWVFGFNERENLVQQIVAGIERGAPASTSAWPAALDLILTLCKIGEHVHH